MLNFFRHWILNHSYDFTDDPELKKELLDFLESIRAGHFRLWISRLKSHMNKIGRLSERDLIFDHSPPPILHHLEDQYPMGLMTVHPVELARQVTLLEFSAFKKIRPCELIGTAWTKSKKYEIAPNVMRAIEFHNEFTFWLEKSILETKNLEERVAMCERIADILVEFKSLNNFSGQFCISSAFSSGCVGRLHHTKELIKPEKWELIEDVMKLSDHHYRVYAQRLRMCNPPCVPFLGMWLSRLLHVEEGNRDFIATDVINFSKWRRTADFITEIQQYQNQPYCLEVEPAIQEFVEKLDTKGQLSKDEFDDLLYALSYEIEPKQKNVPLPQFPKQFDFPLSEPKKRLEKQPSRESQGSVRLARGAKAVPLILHQQPSNEMESLRQASGSISSSVSLPNTPSFPTPPSSAGSHWTHFFGASSNPNAPPLPPRPSPSDRQPSSSTDSRSSSSSSLLPPPPPQRPLPSPSFHTAGNGSGNVGGGGGGGGGVPSSLSSSSLSSHVTAAAPPLPPRPLPSKPPSAGPFSSQRTRFEYPTPSASSSSSYSSDGVHISSTTEHERQVSQ